MQVWCTLVSRATGSLCCLWPCTGGEHLYGKIENRKLPTLSMAIFANKRVERNTLWAGETTAGFLVAPGSLHLG